jgi:hypothetical protein
VTGTERLQLERAVVAACLDSDDCLFAALEVIPPRPFRSHEADELERVWYWCAAMWERGLYDSIRNRGRLLDAMNANGWPPGWLPEEREGWLDSALAWAPLIYQPDGVREICEVLRDGTAAFELAVAARRRRVGSVHVVRVLAEAAPVVSPSREGEQATAKAVTGSFLTRGWANGR